MHPEDAGPMTRDGKKGRAAERPQRAPFRTRASLLDPVGAVAATGAHVAGRVRHAQPPHQLVKRALAALIAYLAGATEPIGPRDRGCLAQPRLDLGRERSYRRGPPHAPGLSPRAMGLAVGRTVDLRSIDRHVRALHGLPE